MGKVTQFLLRWLYLASLIDDRVDLRNAADHSLESHLPGSSTYFPSNFHNHDPIGSTPNSKVSYSSLESPPHINDDIDEQWKRKCLQGIFMYPMGTLRCLAVDSLRLEIVHTLALELKRADEILRRHAAHILQKDHLLHTKNVLNNDHHSPPTMLDLADPSSYNEQPKGTSNNQVKIAVTQESNDERNVTNLNRLDVTDETMDDEKMISTEEHENLNNDAWLDADLEIIRALHTVTGMLDSNLSEESIANKRPTFPCPDENSVLESQALLLEAREYLPQLVCTVLHSNRALTSQPSLDPVAAMRKLMITRCLEDPSLGIELCWLLEAEVGRAWKQLFEHRQQTGRRLIVVLPAEKAQVIAKIGTEKKEAFDLLQDAEQATAYASCAAMYGSDNEFDNDFPPKIPAALSLRRCSHFGDTMYFIDAMTKISLDLRMVPVADRNFKLRQRLSELNRRIRRRMVTRGAISLDVSDNLSPESWPFIKDLTLDMLRYSVHMPLTPKTVKWDGGDDHPSYVSNEISAHTGVMRVLNIVTSECRVLSSRERCPFLVQCEVAETGLDGGDARMYGGGGSFSDWDHQYQYQTDNPAMSASFGQAFGVTLEEAMRCFATSKSQQHDQTFAPYRIPIELLSCNDAFILTGKHGESSAFVSTKNTSNSNVFRGGSQRKNKNSSQPEKMHTKTITNDSTAGYQSDAYNALLEEQMQTNDHHSHIYQDRQMWNSQETSPNFNRLVGSALLDKIYGITWPVKCRQIRQSSPFGRVKGWRLASFILKAGEDIRREALVMQVIAKLNGWFCSDILDPSMRPYLRPYTIMCVGGDAGLVECITDAKSLDEVKKSTDGYTTLRDYFLRAYGSPSNKQKQPKSFINAFHQHEQQQKRQQLAFVQSENPEDSMIHRSFHSNINSLEVHSLSFEEAQDNFLRSLVGYSIVCYVLQVKDRHNANILLDRKGHIMHIDFGFVLGDTPKMGKVPIFSERAPFKLTTEFWDLLGGWDVRHNGQGVRFCKMFEVAFSCASSHAEDIASLVEAAVLNLTNNRRRSRAMADGVRSRLQMRGQKDSKEQQTFIMNLVDSALTSWGTSTYDWLQKNMNGYET